LKKIFGQLFLVWISEYKIFKMKLCIYSILIIFTFPIIIHSQNLGSDLSTSQPLKYSGSLSLSSEFYSANGIENRLPGNTQRAVLRTVFSIYDVVQLPFEIYLSNQDSKYQQPFNQIGITPQISNWLKLDAGYFTTRLSDLSFGDVRLLGGGIEITPGNFRLKVFYGQSRSSVEADSARSYFGTYKQTTFAASLGYGNMEKSFVNINLFHAIDDSNSIKRSSFTITPNENLVSSVDFAIQPMEEFTLSGEVAASAFSNDITSSKLTDDPVKVPSFFFTPRVSSQIDGAAKLSLNIKPSRYWSLILGSKWIGPGFVTLGYSQMANDLLEFTATPSLRLIDGRMNIRGSVGVRSNNVRNNMISTTRRFTGLLSVDYQISNEFGFNLQFNNNQIKSEKKNDTLKVSNILNYFILSPRYNFQEFGGLNNIVLTYSFQNSEDANGYTVNTPKTLTNTLNFSHTIFFPSTLSFSTSVLYNKVDLNIASSKMFNVTETAGHSFFNNKMNTSIGIGVAAITFGSSSTNLVFRLNTSYTLDAWGTISLNISNNRYTAGDTSTPSYSEIQGMLQYDISF